MKKLAVISVIVILAAAAVILGLMYSQTNNKLADTQNQLSEKIAALIEKTSELNSTQSKLTQTASVLDDTEKDLSTTKETLTKTDNELETTQAVLSDTKSELAGVKTDLGASRVKVNTMQTQIDLANAKIAGANLEKEELVASISLYKETFGEVFQGVQPLYVVNDSTPPAWNAQGPFSAPLRLFNIVNNPNAKNPTYEQVLNFLQQDKTDMDRYILDYYMCGNFAETLHNRAEAAGIRTGIVILQYNQGIGHAIDAFLTTDRGLIYIDDTGSETAGPASFDCVVTGLKINSVYYPTFLFPSGYYFLPQSKTVTDLEIYW